MHISHILFTGEDADANARNTKEGLGKGMTFEKAAKSLTLRHAMTVHKSQSRTLAGHVRICPGSRPGHVAPHWSMNHLLVVASRATALANLSME